MGRTLRAIGLLAIAIWAVLLLVGEFLGWESPRRSLPVLFLGVALMIGGILLDIVSRAGRVIRRPRCARCSRPVQKGETYCPDHFRDAINRIRDKTDPY